MRVMQGEESGARNSLASPPREGECTRLLNGVHEMHQMQQRAAERHATALQGKGKPEQPPTRAPWHGPLPVVNTDNSGQKRGWN